MPKKHCPKKALFPPSLPKKWVNRDKIAYVSALNFWPSPNFSAKAPRAFAQDMNIFTLITYIFTFTGRWCPKIGKYQVRGKAQLIPCGTRFLIGPYNFSY